MITRTVGTPSRLEIEAKFREKARGNYKEETGPLLVVDLSPFFVLSTFLQIRVEHENQKCRRWTMESWINPRRFGFCCGQNSFVCNIGLQYGAPLSKKKKISE